MIKRKPLFTALILLLIAGTLAITQESEEYSEEETPALDDELSPDINFEDEPPPPPPLPDWVKPARWYRSNTAGMALEENPSRLAAMRNEYALVIDFVNREELPDVLLPFYIDHYIEIRVLYHKSRERRRQWIFRDGNGLYRLVAVFTGLNENEEPADDELAAEEVEDAAQETDAAASAADMGDALPAGNNGDTLPDGNDGDALPAGNDGDLESEDETAAETAEHRTHSYRNFSGFIEIYGDDLLIEREIVFSGDDDVRETRYIYNKGTLIRAEALQSNGANPEPRKILTDYYRYNRSGSLRLVERTYHEQLSDEKAIIRFASRVLDAAANSMFLSDQLFLSSDFFDEFDVEQNQKMVYTTDERSRILTQSLLDSNDEVIWIIKNTWSGERIASALKTEGDEQKLNEYDYNSGGNLIGERNFLNGVLQRELSIDGDREIEELYMNGAAVLRAVWENGKKVSEQRLRPGDSRAAREEREKTAEDAAPEQNARQEEGGQ